MNANTERLETLDPIAFVAALVIAPVLVALLGFWALLIPVFALVIGGPVYLAVGAPLLLVMVTRVPMQASVYACAGLIAQSVLTVLLMSYAGLNPSSGAGDLGVLALFGLVFAPIWAAVFAVLYRRWHRPARLFPVM